MRDYERGLQLAMLTVLAIIHYWGAAPLGPLESLSPYAPLVQAPCTARRRWRFARQFRLFRLSVELARLRFGRHRFKDSESEVILPGVHQFAHFEHGLLRRIPEYAREPLSPAVVTLATPAARRTDGFTGAPNAYRYSHATTERPSTTTATRITPASSMVTLIASSTEWARQAQQL